MNPFVGFLVVLGVASGFTGAALSTLFLAAYRLIDRRWLFAVPALVIPSYWLLRLAGRLLCASGVSGACA